MMAQSIFRRRPFTALPAANGIPVPRAQVGYSSQFMCTAIGRDPAGFKIFQTVRVKVT